jgi:hypothetical protein
MGQAKELAMQEEARGWSNTNKYVCDSCFTSPPLQAAIRANSTKTKHCDFCDAPQAASLDGLMENNIMPAILEQYVAAVEELGWSDSEWVGETIDTEDLIEEIFLKNELSACDKLTEEIKKSIMFTSWCVRDYYGMKPDELRLFYWRKFAEIVKHSNRYFFVDAVIGEDVDCHKKTTLHFLSELKTIIEDELLSPIPSDSRFYRTRIGTEKYTTLFELGAPPYKTATHANRMSPAGVSMLYGAFDPVTAQCEVEPLKNNEFLTLALIATKRKTRVINFCKLPEVPGFFELDQRERRFLCKFLYEFVEDLRKPIKKDGQEHIEYVPTQVLTEYLKSIMPIDGMIFPSARQEGGQNLVLWGKDFVPYFKDSPLALKLASVYHKTFK